MEERYYSVVAVTFFGKREVARFPTLEQAEQRAGELNEEAERSPRGYIQYLVSPSGSPPKMSRPGTGSFGNRAPASGDTQGLRCRRPRSPLPSAGASYKVPRGPELRTHQEAAGISGSRKEDLVSSEG